MPGSGSRLRARARQARASCACRLTDRDVGVSAYWLTPTCKARYQMSSTTTYTTVAIAAITPVISKTRCRDSLVGSFEPADDLLLVSIPILSRAFGVAGPSRSRLCLACPRQRALSKESPALPVTLRGEPHVLAWWHAPCLWWVKLLVALDPRGRAAGEARATRLPSAVLCGFLAGYLEIHSFIVDVWAGHLNRRFGCQSAGWADFRADSGDRDQARLL